MANLLHLLDDQVSVVSEDFARRLTRRKFILRTAKGVVTGMAAISLGSLVGMKNAFAAQNVTGNGCCYITPGVTLGCKHSAQGGVDCGAHGFGNCPSAGCPSGCQRCYSNTCPEICSYSSSQMNGCWVGYSGYCDCGFGYKLCCDCQCTSCSRTCTCLSQVICCGCCAEADLLTSIATEQADGNQFDPTPLLSKIGA
jgi:hypothetical protein